MSEQDAAGGSVGSPPAFKAVVVKANVTLYECQQCGALVTEGGQKKHRKSHAQVHSMILDYGTRFGTRFVEGPLP